MKSIASLCFLLLASLPALADPWVIEDKVREDCEKIGGCLLTLPEGKLLPTKEVNEMIIELQKRAFREGVEQGKAAKSCTGKDA